MKIPLMQSFIRTRRIFFGWYIVVAAAGLNLYFGATLIYGFPVYFQAILDEFQWS